MPAYVDPAVEALRESSGEGTVRLLLGVIGDRDEITSAVTDSDASVIDRIGHSALLVEAPKSSVEALCSLDGISSVELDHDDVAVLNRGNGRSRPRLTR
ncbi:hypothetical protein [Halovivax cerinus]|uniref:Putative peptidase inhibitor domain-containing protein n=1 Tax=Halovivax cerinus TaxID=1487865 RepID=A0ABD5NRU2_9EURY|nr:hypothetical protein [Halovivax cerinus]